MSGTTVQQGTAGDDILVGGAADDTLEGLGGDDTLSGGAGSNMLDGGDGHDVADYSGAAGRVVIDMTYQWWTERGLAWQVYDNGSGGQDSLVSIEEVVGSAHSDELTGGSLHVTLRGRGGDDLLAGGTGGGHLDGGDGDDTLLGGDGAVTMAGGAGNNQLIGGAGHATADYSGAASGVEVSLAGYWAQNGEGGTDFLYGISAVVGSDRADRITGTHGTTSLRGGAGNDTILLYDDTNPADPVISGGSAFGEDGDDWVEGNEGDNFLSGGEGDDTLLGLGGDDTLSGGSGDNLLVGGGGTNTADFAGAAHGVTVSLQHTVSTAHGLAAVALDNGWGGRDLLVDVTAVSGSSHGDLLAAGDGAATLCGMGGDDRLVGGAGNDTLDGGDGDDLLSGGAGANLLLGGAGHDLADYSGAAKGLVIDLATVVQTAHGAGLLVADNGSGGTDTLVGVEGILGSAFADRMHAAASGSHLVGGAGADYLYGRGGADILDGGDGDDSLQGGNGDDLIIGGAGGNSISGGGGNDTIYANDVGLLLGGRNYVSGDAGDDTIYGGRFSDGLSGGDGDDAIYGGAGDDVLSGDAGNNHIDGGTGTDVASFTGATSGVRLDFRAGGVHHNGFGGVDTLVSIEAVRGSSHGDTMIAGDNAMQFLGYAGDDTLIGGAGLDAFNGGDGNDILNGRGGRDWLVGGGGADTFVIDSLADAGDTVTDFSAAEGDRLWLGAMGFGDLPTGSLAAASASANGEARLVRAASGHAATADGWQFVQDGTTGALWFDADGTGTGTAVLVANLGGNPWLTGDSVFLA